MLMKRGMAMHLEGKRALAIFAHNESENIVACLDSVKRTMREGDTCFVLNNGSNDDTGAVVARYAQTNPFCHRVDIALGDKANAWNVFVHELGAEAGLYCFLDGDCAVAPGALDALEACLLRHPEANAAAALPAANVSRKNRETMLREGGLAGNLYALSAAFVARIRAGKVRLPVGLIGDDSLTGALAYWDLDPQGDWDTRRIVTCADASFSYSRFSPLSARDVRLYYRRKIRYSLRQFQNDLMRRPLKDLGLAALPANMVDLYRSRAGELKLSWRGLDTWFDYLALKRIRGAIAAQGDPAA
jgi:glycosyltransferase involved in cell wall biosynthesis